MTVDDLGSFLQKIFCPVFFFLCPIMVFSFTYAVVNQKISGGMDIPQLRDMVVFYFLNILVWALCFRHCYYKLGWFKKK